MDTRELKKTIEDFLSAMGLDVFELESSLGQDQIPRFLIKTPHSGLLIGTNGEHLSALTYLLRKIVSSREKSQIKFFIDVNNYQEQNLSLIKNKALVIADRVRSFKASIEMDPMTSYERMIIHSLFTETPDIKTESEGYGSTRRVVIKYVGN